MKEIRKAAVDNLELRKELTNSIDSIQRFLDNRTSHLSLHNQNFKSALPAKDEDMKYFFEAIHDIESEISAENTTAQDLKKHLNIQQFLKTHCQSRQYTFQVKAPDESSQLGSTRESSRVESSSIQEFSIT
ncbi:hypothetical protein RirG_264430 [Rhizophagus irregularis DAOM 197198w]|uniref:Uncharacterized protein n=1 Tax=Rhizophagus irregularis (strain DAOM 197198w) TaxID=1432141 RepID=A0A015I2C6_RHIIW|nr:hypothetical protein RirG_264430 [Rhizophagus irregularis DAOM 197198w]